MRMLNFRTKASKYILTAKQISPFMSIEQRAFDRKCDKDRIRLWFGFDILFLFLFQIANRGLVSKMTLYVNIYKKYFQNSQYNLENG